MSKKYSTYDKEPSELFVDSLRGGGSHYMVCGFCGRTHYCPESSNIYHNDEDKEDEENAYKNYLSEALEEQKKDPDGVVIHYGVDTVIAKDLNGMTFVLECPCNGLTKYETFIWAERDSIRRFLQARIEQEAQWVREEIVKNKLMGIPPPKKNGIGIFDDLGPDSYF